MKAIKAILLIALWISLLPHALAAHMQFVPVDNVYAPNGYNANDDVEVVISGFLPNLCYQGLRANSRVKDNVIEIDMLARNNSGPNIACAEMIVPYLESVSLGVLDKGWYDIKVNGKASSAIYIDESVDNAIEEEFFANIENVIPLEGNRVKLIGHNPSDCYQLDSIQVENNGKDVYSVYPIMNKVSDFCPMKMVPFELEFEVPRDLDSERVLIHVRSMYGESVNSLFLNSAI